jgi:hypothetical protein
MANRPARDPAVPTEAELAALLSRYRETLGTRWDVAPDQEEKDRALVTLFWQQSHNTPRKRRRPQGPPTAPATKAAACALAIYMHRGEDFDEAMPARAFAKKATDYATAQGLEGADLLDPNGATMRDLAAGILQALRMTREQ